VVRVVS